VEANDMSVSHDTLVFAAQTFGLFYLIAFSIGVLVYVYWPSNRGKFKHAAEAILQDEDKPCR
jgi:cytochrome c oxidase cbb3-type subunit 4